MPPMAYVIIALGVILVATRFWMAKVQAKREEAREERMAKLLAEREALREAMGPSSIGAVVSDTDPKLRSAPRLGGDAAASAPAAGAPRVKVRCRGCKALNDEDAALCASCGAEL